ncbi:MAG: lipopolysaccharide biosynthesis protein [Halioglobus sp.]|nr:lipopolysaccharide biosynthesis protein [Halioglobus sp.]
MPESIKERAVRGSVWAAGGGYLSRLFSLFIFALLARILSPEEFGLMAVAGVFVALGQTITNPGLSQAIVNIESISESVTGTAFRTSLALAVAVAAVLSLGAFLLLPYYGDTEIRNLILVMSPILIIGVFPMVPQALLAREFRFKQITVAIAAANILGGIAALVAAVSDLGVWALVIQQYVTAVCTLVLMMKLSKWRPAGGFSKSHLSNLLAHGGHYFGIGLVGFANRRLDDALVGFVFGIPALGIYVIAKRVLKMLTELLIQPLSGVSLSVFARLEGDKEAIRSAYSRIVTMTSVFSVPIFIGFIAISRDFILLAFSDKWEMAIEVLQLLCLAGLFRGVTYFTVPLLTAIRRGKLAFALHLSNTLGNFIAYLIFIPFGLIGIGMGFSSRALVFFVVSLLVVRAVLGVSMPQLFRQLVPVVLSAMIMSAVLTVTGPYVDPFAPVVSISITVLIGFVAYISPLFILKRQLVTEPIKLLRGAFGV